MKNIALLSGTGNRFVLLNCLNESPPQDPAQLAQALCAPEPTHTPEPRIDGLLLALPAEGTGDLKLVIYNADGSRPEICGNGLRCLGYWAWQHAEFERRPLTIETDAGLRTLQPDEDASLVHAHLGTVHVEDAVARVHVLGRDLDLFLANAGNPHAVLLVEDLVDAPVQELGAALQQHERFPEGVNLEFVFVEPHEASVRVYERGVGETLACGSGACAVAAVLRHHCARLWPIRIRMSGGALDISADETDGVWLSGSVSEHELDDRIQRCLATF